MYRALYRKWRPKTFGDVVGQEDITAALKNQVLHDRVGHAYLFTGTRGTGKTTCARIFAKAINCENPQNGEPCGECFICKGIDEGSVTDIVEIDAASNNSVNDIRDLREETVYTPSVCAYKVYIIDEAHMLTDQAFNALLKIMEEPPSHVIFILATTEIQKIKPTILSRCQRYDFARITPDLIEARISYVAEQEGVALTQEAAALIARLADGAMRDALSILDTCAGVENTVDEPLVRRMAGVTDKSYLFDISQAAAAGDAGGAIALCASLQERSVDVRRLCGELIRHYRNLLLAGLPDGERFLTGVAPEDGQRYVRDAASLRQDEAIRAIRCLGAALDRMGKSTDARVELELALFRLCEPETPAPAAPPQTRSSAPAAPVRPPEAQSPAPAAPRPFETSPRPAAPIQNLAQPSAPPQEQSAAPGVPAAPPQAQSPAPPAPPQYPRAAAPLLDPPVVFEQWEQVIEKMKARSQLLYVNMRGSTAYCDGRRILIDGSPLFIEFMRRDDGSKNILKQVIAEVTGAAYAIGPYKKKPAEDAPQRTAEDTLRLMEEQGVDVTYISE